MVTLQLTLSDDTFARLQRLAQITGLDMETVLNGMPLLAAPLLQEFDTTLPSSLSDEAVLAIADSHLDLTLSARLSDLHTQQNAQQLTPSAREELQLLMGVYQAGQIRKAEAMVEAVRRGLRAKGSA